MVRNWSVEFINRLLNHTKRGVEINIRELKAPFTLIRFQTKTELFCSVFKKICVHTYRFRIVFVSPHYNDHQESSHMEPSVRHFGYSRLSGLAPGRVYLDDVTVFR